MLCTLVFMYCLQYIRQLSSFRVPTLWFIDLTVATCHIQNMFLSLYQLFHKKTDKTTQTYSYFVILYKNDHRWLLGTQSINTERVSLRINFHYTPYILTKHVIVTGPNLKEILFECTYLVSHVWWLHAPAISCTIIGRMFLPWPSK